MKNILLSVCTVSAAFSMSAQTATNFTANDCAGNTHDLFTELNAGKVIVIAWVMPCAGCTAATQTANLVVQNYAVSNPGQVIMYVVDDYGNTQCNSLNNWVNTNSIVDVTIFSDSSIDMTAYGGVGMPKIVVLGGGFGHGVYFNENNNAAEDSLGIANAIDSALADVTGIILPVVPALNSVFPNPSDLSSTLLISAAQPVAATIDIVNELGQVVKPVFNGNLVQGENRFLIPTADLPAGTYFIRVKDAENTALHPLSVVH